MHGGHLPARPQGDGIRIGQLRLHQMPDHGIADSSRSGGLGKRLARMSHKGVRPQQAIAATYQAPPMHAEVLFKSIPHKLKFGFSQIRVQQSIEHTIGALQARARISLLANCDELLFKL